MADHRLLITHSDGTLQLSWQRGQAAPRFTDPIPFEHPFDAKTLERLRWYLEDYISFPYGIFPDQAAQIEQQFQTWGQRLFEQVFYTTDEGRAFYQEATRERLDRCEIGIASDNPIVLNLPWELLYAPDEQFLAPKLAGVYRSLSSQKVRAPLPALPTEQLNILLVIARPYKQDVGFQTIAGPMLEALRPLRDQQLVNLKVLRPPTFGEFERELNTHRDGFYHIVHFDGHGTFDPNAQGAQYQLTGETGQGQLVFETVDGQSEVINADRIAQSLQACRVPIFVLNACKSAQEGGEKFSSVAARFVFAGAQGVVAMAYSVYADGAKEFIGRFYGELTRGVSVAEAVAAARISMLNQPQRQSPRGSRLLRDWLVPVLYQQETYTPLQRQTRPPSFAELMNQADTAAPQSPTAATVLPEEGTYGFVGRSYDILRLERAFRRSPVVLLKGMGGVGKTELSLGFARWLAETQGREGGLFFTSFERGATLSNVVNDIGRQLGGDRFAALMADQQEATVLQYLQTHPCLLIWDNFEPVAGFPAGNEPLLPELERQRLQSFLKALRGGESWVLISSRREEPWLDCGYELLELRGLVLPDAEVLAAKILQSVGVDRSTLPPEYLELLTLLNGHPLSLRVVLPQLKTHSADTLLTALRDGLDTFAGAEEEGRDKSLTVSLDYSFHTLSSQARQHLPFLAFFTERVDADWLSAFSSDADKPFGQAYQAVFGSNPSKDTWLALLQEAAEAGILQPIHSTIYQLHPTLPWYLRRAMAVPSDALTHLESQLL
ncbi:MAG: CHAT domain-containing protein, partial [Cyanobacteria bacterium J06626_23]